MEGREIRRTTRHDRASTSGSSLRHRGAPAGGERASSLVARCGRVLGAGAVLVLLSLVLPGVAGAQTCTASSSAVTGFTGTLDDLVTDCTTLLGLKDTLRGTATLNWAETLAMTSWAGIVVAGDPPQVTGLDLRGRSLSGSLPAALGDLSALTRLNLSGNVLSGSLPSALGNLSALTSLWLSGNRLSGALPTELGSLNALKDLKLHGNANLSGALPDSFSTGLTGLTELQIQNTKVTVPDTSAFTTWLAGLTLSEGTHGSLARQVLADTSAPRWLWSNGTTVWVVDQAAATVRAYRVADWTRDTAKDIALAADHTHPRGLWSDGRTLWVVQDNRLGSDELWAYWLDGSGRDPSLDIALSANLGFSYGMWSDGDTVWVASRSFAFDGSRDLFAYSLATGARRASKDISLSGVNNEPRGVWSDGTTIWVADDEDARLYAYTLADDMRDADRDLLLASGNLSPAGLWVDGTMWWVVDAVDTGLYRYLPPRTYATDRAALEALYVALDGDNWPSFARTNWNTTEPLNNWAGVTADSDDNVTRLELRSDNLSGSLPAALGDLRSLETLALDGNDISGPIPPEIGNLRNLKVLRLEDNQLSGSIPPELGYLRNLEDLHLEHNQLSGAIPPELRHLSRIDEIYLGNNDLSGSIPPELGDLHTLTVLELNNNDLSGAIPAALENLRRLWWLRLDSNDLSGSIPAALWDLPDLRRLYFSHNAQLTGKVPTDVPAARRHLAEVHVQNTQVTVPPEAAQALFSENVTLSAGTRTSSRTTALSGINSPVGLWSNGTTLWVLDLRLNRLYAYRLANGNRDAGKDITLDAGNRTPTGLWSDGTTVWVTKNSSSERKLFAYELVGGARDADKDMDFRTDAQSLRGLWSDGTVAWVAEYRMGGDDNKLFAYNLADGTRVSAQDIDITLANQEPHDLWSDGKTLWVADDYDGRLYAYDLSTRQRAPAQDVVLDPENLTPRGIWSDGDTWWVADAGTHKLYRYDPPPPPPPQRLRALPGEAQITLTWQRPESVTSPIVITHYAYRQSENGGAHWTTWTDIPQSGPGESHETSYTIPSLTGDTAYTYEVRAENSFGDSDPSNRATTAPYPSPPPRTYADDRAALGALYDALGLATIFDDRGITDHKWKTAAPLAEWYGVKVDSGNTVIELDLSGLGLSGAIPAAVGDLRSLEVLDLSDNQLSGPIPTAVGNLRNLEDLDLSDNQLSGPIPPALRYLGRVEFLYLDHNQLSGAIPAAVGDLYMLTQLYLHHNRLSGAIPPELGNLSGLWWLRLDSNDLRGDIPAALWDLGSLRYLYLSHNAQLTGAVPTDVGTRLPDLKEVHLQNTRVTVPAEAAQALASNDVTLSTGTRTSSRTTALDAANTSPVGLWSDGTTLWVLDSSKTKLFAYTLADSSRDADKDLALRNPQNRTPTGLWSDGTTLWVTRDSSSGRKLFAYTLADGTRDADKDMDFRTGANSLRGLWSDGMVAWVVEYREGPSGETLFAYTLATKSRATAQDIDIIAANSEPHDLWSDGETLWVADDYDGRLYAYDLRTRQRAPAKDIVLDPENLTPRGIWSNGETWWVVDAGTHKLYRYDPTPPPPPPRRNTGGGGGRAPRDLHGNTAATATVVALSGSAPWASSTAGQLDPATDVDYFTVTVPQAGVLVVETTGATDTVGTVWQDGVELGRADSGGAGQNFRLSVPVQAGPVVIAVAGAGGQTGAYRLVTRLVVGVLENPGPGSRQSGLGLVSGWVCAADVVELEINGIQQVVAAAGTARADTAQACGDPDNGFGLLFNWNLLGDGVHTVVALADGVVFDQATFTVTTLGEEFVRDATGETVLADFPAAGEDVRLLWQQAQQNFVLAPLDESPPPASPPSPPGGPVGALENPSPASFQSGLGLVSGWVCEADVVELEINGGPRITAASGTARTDTADVCGDPDTGFGLLFNWNLLGDGVHTVVALADGVEFGRATFTVTTLGAEFVRGVVGETVVEDFPAPGEAVRLVWQEATQNFMLAPLP